MGKAMKKGAKPKPSPWRRRQLRLNRECREAVRTLTKAKFYNHHIALQEIVKAQGANSAHLVFVYPGQPSTMSVGIYPTKKAQRDHARALRRQ